MNTRGTEQMGGGSRMTDNDLILCALRDSRDGCYSLELKAEYQRLIDEREEKDDDQQQLGI